MAAADPLFESLQRIPSMIESFDEEPEELRTSGETSGENKENKTSKVTGSNPAISSFTKVLSCVDVRSEIKTLCDKADGRGLRKYIMNNMKAVEILRNELPVALRKAPDVARLVMNALELPFSTNRKACILLLESLYNIFGNDDSCVVPSDVKDSAREIAKAWRKDVKIEKNTGRAGRKKIRAFLKFLASFRIAADYDRDELWGLLLAVSSEVQTLELCRSLGLTPNVSG